MLALLGFWGVATGRGGGTRTHDPLIKSQLLFQLSYTSTKKMERAKGFEPSTTTLARWSSTTELRSPNQSNQAALCGKLHTTQGFFSKKRGL